MPERVSTDFPQTFSTPAALRDLRAGYAEMARMWMSCGPPPRHHAPILRKAHEEDDVSPDW